MPASVSNKELQDELRTSRELLRAEFDAKFDAMKWRIVAALVGGQALAGLIASVVAGHEVRDIGRSALSAVGLL